MKTAAEVALQLVQDHWKTKRGKLPHVIAKALTAFAEERVREANEHSSMVAVDMDKALRIARAEALEEAAKIAEKHRDRDCECWDSPDCSRSLPGEIRAIKGGGNLPPARL